MGHAGTVQCRRRAGAGGNPRQPAVACVDDGDGHPAHPAPERPCAQEIGDTTMGDKVQKVAGITAASQGTGEALVVAYRKLGYAVVANSRSIKPSEDVGVLTVQGALGDPATAQPLIIQGL